MSSSDRTSERDSKSQSTPSAISQTASSKAMLTYDDVPVKTSGREAPSPIEKWSDADLGRTLLNNIEHAGYSKPTPVQKHSIPIVMKARDLMGCAQTGSGKTAAFLLPIVAKMHASRDYGRRDRGPALPICLILAPTRELVSQIYDEACKFAHKTGIRSAVIYGGTPLFKSIQTVHSGCDILVATPGRLVDLMQKREVSVSTVKYLVLDEADRMLDMGFEPQIRQIVEKSGMPATGQRQTLMFSATFPTEIQQLAASFLKDYVFLTVGRVGAATTLVTQKFVNVDSYQKQNALMDLIRTIRGLCLIFVETKKKASQLEKWLSSQGLAASSIHGDREQRDRERALRAFSTGQTPFLIATNVAARGLDIDNVAHVINFDMPANIDDYVHRIGRTGRAGKAGISTSFLSEKDLGVVPKLLDLLYDNSQEPPSWMVTMGQAAKYHRDMKMRNKKPRFGAKDFRQEYSANKYGRDDKEGYDDRDTNEYVRRDERDEGPLAKRFKSEGSSSLPVNTNNVSAFIASASSVPYSKPPYPSSYGGNTYSNGSSSSYGSSSGGSSSYGSGSSYPPSSSSYPPSSSSHYSSSGSSYPTSSHGSSSSSSSYPSSSSSSYPSSYGPSSGSSSGNSGTGSSSSAYVSRWDKRKREDFPPSSSGNGSGSGSSANNYSSYSSSSYPPSSSSAPSSSYGSYSGSQQQQAPNTQSAYYYAQAYAAQQTPSQMASKTPDSTSSSAPSSSSSSSSSSAPSNGGSSSNAQAYADVAYQQYQQYYQNYYQNYYNGNSGGSYPPPQAKPPAPSTSSPSTSSTASIQSAPASK